ncbi:olfactory receptor 2H2-like [Tachyglossus aculeatus]|uniref:olfactory receptor 2H2-like n=1 Tax=Tachyglossus aculeatus TaxID=9261 RepID=UPI0018F4B3D3|nr:olfactory receptor 2H2-like [Tachyglossus aculeatus]
MGVANHSSMGDFILAGFSNQPEVEVLLFGLLSIFYFLTLVGNSTIILVSCLDPRLHTPMYFFLSNLSFLELGFTTSCVPQMLVNLIRSDRVISHLGCVAQLYIFLWLGATECVLLVVMAFDRYVAICQPLNYLTIMHPRLCFLLATVAWGAGLIQALIQFPSTLRLSFCHTRLVDDFVCEVPALIHLACGDTTINEVQMSVSSVLFLVVPLILILVSYGHIAGAVMSIKSSSGCRKTWRTCGSHLVVVFLFYGTVSAVYLHPKNHYAQQKGKFLTLLCTAVTPMLNPLIYSLQNKEVKEAVRRLARIGRDLDSGDLLNSACLKSTPRF